MESNLKLYKCAPANRVRVLVFRKSLATPCYAEASNVRNPWRAAKSGVSLRSIIRKSGMLRRRVKSDVLGGINSSSVPTWQKFHRHAERLDPAIKVLVKDRVFIMVHAADRARHFVSDKCTAIYSRLRFNRLDGCSRPGGEGRGHPHGRANLGESEVGCASDTELQVGGIVIHVAFPRVRLTPTVFVRRDIDQFRIVGCARVHRLIQIVGFNQDHVRHGSVIVAGVIPGVRGEDTGKRIDPCP